MHCTNVITQRDGLCQKIFSSAILKHVMLMRGGVQRVTDPFVMSLQ